MTNLQEKLLTFYKPDGPERVGFILPNDEVVEVENTSAQPLTSFDVGAQALIDHAEVAVGTWHTHPGSDSNLSEFDYDAFKAWPQLQHIIIGNNGIRKFAVDNGAQVIEVDAT